GGVATSNAQSQNKMAAKAMHMVSALLLGLPQLGKLAIDGGRPFSRRDGDIPAISASDEIERGERRRNGLNARAQLGFTALISRMDMGVAQLASTADNSNNAPVRISPSTNGLLYPDLKLPFDHVNQHLDPFVAVIEARNVAELFAAMLEEDVLVILRNLLKRLNAIGGKAWADDGNPLDSVSR